jgi:hypothetical protein
VSNSVDVVRRWFGVALAGVLQRGRVWSAVGAGVMVAAIAAAVGVVGTSLSDVPAHDDVGPPWLDWPLVQNRHGVQLASDATASWDANAGAHTEVRPLALMNTADVGVVAVLQGRDSAGRARLAVLTQSVGGRGGRGLVVRADRPLPDRAAVRQISMVTDRLGDRPGSLSSQRGSALGVLLGWPAAKRVAMTAPPVPRPASGTADGRFLALRLPEYATAFATQISIDGDGVHIEGWADEDSIGARRSFPAVMIQDDRGGGHTAIRVRGTSPRPGQLLMSRQGVVGRIASVGGGTAVVDRPGSEGFEVVVASAHVPRGIVRSGPAGLAMEAMVGGVRPPPSEMLYAYDDSPDGVSVFPFARLGPEPTDRSAAWPVQQVGERATDAGLFVVAASG